MGLSLQEADQEKDAVIARLRERGYPVTDMTDNEMAKLHVRHMVGGHAPRCGTSASIASSSPSGPGPCCASSITWGSDWNISMFHYRNHGAAYGRVLVGLQVPPAEEAEFQKFLADLGYPWIDETANAAYELFLS